METKQEQRNKRFDEKFFWEGYWQQPGPDELKAFLQSEVDLAVAEERERIKKGLTKLPVYHNREFAESIKGMFIKINDVFNLI